MRMFQYQLKKDLKIFYNTYIILDNLGTIPVILKLIKIKKDKNNYLIFEYITFNIWINDAFIKQFNILLINYIFF